MVDQYLKGPFDFRDMVLEIAADPDLGQTAKLFAFCMASYRSSPVHAVEGNRSGTARSWVQVVGDMMIGQPRTGVGGEETATEIVRRVIAEDIPRYQLERREHLSCPVRKTRGPSAGLPCGKSATNRWVERNPQTGEGTHVGYCSDHFTTTHRLRHADLLRQWEANGKPLPVANVGGILARYFAVDWAHLYRWANPRLEPLPDGKPPTQPSRPPRLTLIQGGGAAS